MRRAQIRANRGRYPELTKAIKERAAQRRKRWLQRQPDARIIRFCPIAWWSELQAIGRRYVAWRAADRGVACEQAAAGRGAQSEGVF